MIQSSLLHSPWYFLLPRPHEDFREIGHTFEHTKVDSCHLLMPQRRERVWGSSCTGAHDTQYPLDMKITMQRLKGPKRFTLGDVLLDGLPTCDPPVSDSFQCQLEKVKKICQERKIDFSTVTMDSSTSRRRSPEYACDMFTCIRPSHRIWLCGHNRFAEPQELLRAHGVFAEEFHVPKAVLDLEPHLAADFAGNAFSTSALIAKILCTMVNGFPWKRLANKVSLSRSGVLNECARRAAKRANEQGPSEPPVEPPSKKRKKQGRKSSKPSRKRAQPAGEPESDPKKVKTDKNNQLRGQNFKGALLTISKKMEILKRYQELAETTKHPEKAWFGLRFVEYLLPDKNGFFLHRTTCRHCLDEYSMYMHRQPNGKPDTFVSLALVGEAYTRRIDMIYSMCWFANPLYHLCGERSPSQNARI